MPLRHQLERAFSTRSRDLTAVLLLCTLFVSIRSASDTDVRGYCGCVDRNYQQAREADSGGGHYERRRGRSRPLPCVSFD